MAANQEPVSAPAAKAAATPAQAKAKTAKSTAEPSGKKQKATAGLLTAQSTGATGSASTSSAAGTSKTKSSGKAAADKTTADKPATDKTVTEPAKASNLPPVLDPSRFFGQAQIGYACAAKVPEICSKLFCYCGCDITDKHCNLLECFASLHGVDCHICQEEALMAMKMSRDGQSLAEIQKQVDINYQQNYPFKEDTKALRTYRATRLWNPIPDKVTTPAGAAETKPQFKDGASAGACCAAGHDGGKEAGKDAGKDSSKDAGKGSVSKEQAEDSSNKPDKK